MSSEELERHLALSAGSPLDMEMRLTEEETYILSENPDGSVFLHTDALIEEDIDVSSYPFRCLNTIFISGERKK